MLHLFANRVLHARQAFSLQSFGAARPFSQTKLLSLDNLKPAPGRKKRKRWGRGPGSGRGKTCGRGHQFSRSTPRGFEGGQTPLYKRLPKYGMKNVFRKNYVSVNIETIQQYIDQGRLVPRQNNFTTMRDLVLAGITNNVRDGIKLLARGKNNLTIPIHLEVSKATPQAIAAVERAGGTVTCSHFNLLALRALIKPYKFDLLPWRARPVPKLMQYYLDKDVSGYLSPEIQRRNLKMFGAATSEKMYREEHAFALAVKRSAWSKEREEKAKTVLAARAKKLEKLKEKAARKQSRESASA